MNELEKLTDKHEDISAELRAPVYHAKESIRFAIQELEKINSFLSIDGPIKDRINELQKMIE